MSTNHFRLSGLVTAAAFVAAIIGLSSGATQAQTNPTDTPVATIAAAAATAAPSLDMTTPVPTMAATLPSGNLAYLLGAAGLPGTNAFGIDFGKAILDAVTQATNLTEGQIVQQMSAGKSLSDVITANNGDPQAVETAAKGTITDQINAAVKAKTLTQARATRLIATLDPLLVRVFTFAVPNVAARITRLIQPFEVRALLAETATESNVSATAVWRALLTGQTLSQIAQANNADPAAIVSAVSQNVTDQINSQVKAGRLTQTQADTLLGDLTKTLTDMMNQANLLQLGGGGAFGGGRPAPSATPAGNSA